MRTHVVLALSVCVLASVCLAAGCDEHDKKQDAGKEDQLRQAQSDLATTRERLQAAQDHADRLARDIQTREQSQGDQMVSLAVAFGCVVSLVLILQLLRRERSARLTLTRLLQWLRQRRNGP
jgi:hypothetical protein